MYYKIKYYNCWDEHRAVIDAGDDSYEFVAGNKEDLMMLIAMLLSTLRSN